MNNTLRHLGMPRLTHAEWLAKLQSSQYLSQPIDCYNNGTLVEMLESRVANLLNKEQALFFPKGCVAQFCALKVAADNKNNNKIMLHPQSHIALDEEDSYQSLLGLQGLLLGEKDQVFNFSQVRDVQQLVASLVVELPLRRAGFKLTPWSDLQAMSEHCKTKDIHFHMDGARLWESTAYYKKPLSEISGLFDSVYVSLYKGLGGIGGSLLVGDKDFIEQCKVWRTRFGGDFFTSFPLIISALDGLDRQLIKMPELVERAKLVAEQLLRFPQLKVNHPQTNGFFIFAQGNLKALNDKANQLNEEMGIKLFNGFNQTEQKNILMAEIQIGGNHHLVSSEDINHYFQRLFTQD